MPPDAPNSTLPLHDAESLLAHVGWVRRLAHRLVHDPDTADDLTQETMLAALQNGASARSPRAWLGRVLRNVLWERVRQNRRREAREQVVANRPLAASSAEVVERVDTQRAVVDAVMRMPPHYRIVLLRRYFEGETPTQIAAALATPTATVKTRLQRGLERLRTELDHIYGDRTRWQPALLALVALPRRAGVASLLAAAAGGLLLALLAFVASGLFGPGAAVAPPTSNPLSQRASIPPPPSLAPPVAERTAAIAATHATDIVDWGAIKMPRRPVRGRVVDASGQPVAGVVLQFHADRRLGSSRGTPVVVSSNDGRFEMQLSRSGRIRTVSDELATMCEGVVAIGSERECCVVVGSARAVVGRVVDDGGNGLAHARLLLNEPQGMRAAAGPSGNRRSQRPPPDYH